MIGASHSNAELMPDGPDLSEICASCGQHQLSTALLDDDDNDDRPKPYFRGFMARERDLNVS